MSLAAKTKALLTGGTNKRRRSLSTRLPPNNGPNRPDNLQHRTVPRTDPFPSASGPTAPDSNRAGTRQRRAPSPTTCRVPSLTCQRVSDKGRKPSKPSPSKPSIPSKFVLTGGKTRRFRRSLSRDAACHTHLPRALDAAAPRSPSALRASASSAHLNGPGGVP